MEFVLGVRGEVGIDQDFVAASSESATVRLFGIWMIPGNWLMAHAPSSNYQPGIEVYFARFPKLHLNLSAKK